MVDLPQKRRIAPGDRFGSFTNPDGSRGLVFLHAVEDKPYKGIFICPSCGEEWETTRQHIRNKALAGIRPICPSCRRRQKEAKHIRNACMKEQSYGQIRDIECILLEEATPTSMTEETEENISSNAVASESATTISYQSARSVLVDDEFMPRDGNRGYGPKYHLNGFRIYSGQHFGRLTALYPCDGFFGESR